MALIYVCLGFPCCTILVCNLINLLTPAPWYSSVQVNSWQHCCQSANIHFSVEINLDLFQLLEGNTKHIWPFLQCHRQDWMDINMASLTNQTDHTLMFSRYYINVHNIRSYCNADINSDHYKCYWNLENLKANTA